MSTLRTNALEGVDAKNSITIVAGAGNVTTTNVQEGLAKVTLMGGTDASRTDSFNVASGTDNGTGDYSYGITNDMASANYTIVGTATNAVANDPVISCNPSDDVTTASSLRLQLGHTGSGTDGFAQVDKVHYSAVFGDLA